jgi:hypothetical protein
MWRLVLGVVGLVGSGLTGAGDTWAMIGQAATDTAPPSPRASFQQSSLGFGSSTAATQRALVDRYCVTCHNQRLRTAALILDTINVDDVSADAATWEKVIKKLHAGAMPPAGSPRPQKESLEAFTRYLESSLDRVAAAQPNPGRPTAHRLNRAEYVNAIQDLLAVDIDGASLLPGDDAAYGFDNNADLLGLSPARLERYLSAARRISRLAIGNPVIRPMVESYFVPKGLVQDDRMSEELPFGSRGGLAIRHQFPLDGEYLFKISLRRGVNGGIAGIGERQQIDVRLDGVNVMRSTIGGEIQGSQEAHLAYTQAADDALQVRVPVKAGARWVGVAFVQRTKAVEGNRLTRLPTVAIEEDVDMSLERLDIGGPYDAQRPATTKSRDRIFVCAPVRRQDEEPCARKILVTLAHRAYRRPVTDEDVEPLLALYRAERAAGPFDTGIQAALERLLVDPNFLFRIEHASPKVASGTVYRVSDIDLASRLSFFLWSSIPDDELLGLAERGKLNAPAVLEEQVRRMLADDRAAALMNNFAAQWLHLRNLRTAQPNVYVFPEFDDNLREAFRQETELFVESQMRADRGIVELLTANYTFVNERLAKHYGIPDIYGSHFRRVTFSDDKRGGLLGHGSLLTVTSYVHRTSPVLRGKWLLENILGAPPPAPPPDVPALKEKDERGGRLLSVRERLEEHRRNPTCAACHARMDPLGFALENFDAIGRWRDTEAGTRIDASAALPDGTRFSTPAEFRQVLVNRRDEFISTFTEKLLTYALGRGLEYYDMPVLRGIILSAAPSDYRWSSVILGIVKSTPFQMTVRRTES